jgi:hypothetical protein
LARATTLSSATKNWEQIRAEDVQCTLEAIRPIGRQTMTEEVTPSSKEQTGVILHGGHGAHPVSSEKFEDIPGLILE